MSCSKRSRRCKSARKETDERNRSFAIARAFDAPLALVWEVYSQEKHLAKWWGPKGFTWVSGTMDFRPGGRFHYCMRSPDGREMWGKFQLPRHFADAEGGVHQLLPPTRAGDTVRAPFAANFPLRCSTM